MTTHERKPCFGKSWSGGDVLCKGGLDPAYQSPKALTEIRVKGETDIPIHRREQCIYYTSCAHQTNFNRMRGHIPPENLTKKVKPQPTPPRSQQVRPPRWSGQSVHQNNQPPPMSQQQYQQWQQQQQWQQPPQQWQQQQWQQQQMVPPWVVGFGPQNVPMPFQQPGAQMPGYLSVPEPFDPRVPGWMRFVVMLLRSAGKAIFHTGAHMADHETFIRHQQPPPPAPTSQPAPTPPAE